MKTTIAKWAVNHGDLVFIIILLFVLGSCILVTGFILYYESVRRNAEASHFGPVSVYRICRSGAIIYTRTFDGKPFYYTDAGFNQEGTSRRLARVLNSNSFGDFVHDPESVCEPR